MAAATAFVAVALVSVHLYLRLDDAGRRIEGLVTKLAVLEDQRSKEANELSTMTGSLADARREIERVNRTLLESRKRASDDLEAALRVQKMEVEREAALTRARDLEKLATEIEEALRREKTHLAQIAELEPLKAAGYPARYVRSLSSLLDARRLARRWSLAALERSREVELERSRIRAAHAEELTRAYQRGVEEGQEPGKGEPRERASEEDPFTDDKLFNKMERKPDAGKEWTLLGFLGKGFSGETGYRGFVHAHRGPQRARRARSEGFLDLTYKGDLGLDVEGLQAKATLEGRFDDDAYATGVLDEAEDDDARRNIGTLREAYLSYSSSGVVVRAGRVIYTFGTGDLSNPTDVLNPRDWLDPLDGEKKGVQAFELGYELAGGKGELAALRGIVVPTFTPSRLPPPGRRFSFLPPYLPAQGVLLDRPDVPPDTFRNAAFALRTEISLAGWDFSATYYNGFNDIAQLRTPGVQPLANFLLFQPIFPRIHMLGLDFATVFFERIQLHAEAAQFITEGRWDDDYVQAVTGLNYTFEEVVSDHALRVIVEYHAEGTTRQGSGLGGGLGRPFRGAFLARLRYEIPEIELPILGVTGPFAIQLTGVLVVDGRDNAYLQPEVSYDVVSGLALRMGADLMEGDKRTFFGQFRDDDRVYFELKYVF